MRAIEPDEAHELVTDLQQRRCSGDDDLALITYLCNRYRISKNDARAIYDSFYCGFQHGADAVLDIDSQVKPRPETDTVFWAASQMSVRFVQDVIEERRRSASGSASNSDGLLTQS